MSSDLVEDVHYDKDEVNQRGRHRPDRLPQLEGRAERRYTEMERRYTEMERRYTEMERRYTEMERRYTEMERRYTEMERRYTEMRCIGLCLTV